MTVKASEASFANTAEHIHRVIQFLECAGLGIRRFYQIARIFSPSYGVFPRRAVEIWLAEEQLALFDLLKKESLGGSGGAAPYLARRSCWGETLYVTQQEFTARFALPSQRKDSTSKRRGRRAKAMPSSGISCASAPMRRISCLCRAAAVRLLELGFHGNCSG